MSQGDWQLVHFIRSSQQKSKPDVFVSESAAHKQLLPTQSSEQGNGDTSKESGLSQHQLHFQQSDFRDDPAAPQRCHEVHENNYLCQQSGKKSLSPKVSSCNKPSKLLKQTIGYSDHTEAALSIECEDTTTPQTKEPCFTDRPKVKTKTGHRKKGSSDTKKDVKRTKHNKAVEIQKAGSEVQPLLCSHCPLCGVSPCSCPAQSPAQSPAPPVKINCNKTKTDSLKDGSNKVPHKPALKGLKKSGHSAKTFQDKLQPPTSLLVKIGLNLLARVPQVPTIPKGTPSSAKRPALVLEQDEGGSDARRHTKTSKKTQNVSNIKGWGCT